MVKKRVRSKNEIMVSEKVSVLDVYNTFITPLSPKKYLPMSDQRITSICPFHGDNDPSLRYWASKNVFHCFGCGFGGDAVMTYLKYHRQYVGDAISIEGAVKLLASRFGIELIEEGGFETQNVFQMARDVLLNEETYKIPKDIVSIADFNKLNNRVVTSKASRATKIANYANLDLIVAVNLNHRK